MDRFLCSFFFSHHTNVGNLGNSQRLSLALCFLLLLLLLLRHRAVRGRGWEELLFLWCYYYADDLGGRIKGEEGKGREVRHGRGSPSAQDQALIKDVYMYKVYIKIGRWECLFVSSIYLFVQGTYLPRIPTYLVQVHNIKASIQQLYY